MSPAELRAEADRLRLESRRLKLEAAALDVLVAEYEDAASRGLTIRGQSDTLNAMDASPESNALRSKSALKTRHPWPKALGEAGDTLSTACVKIGAEVGRKIPKTTAMGWYKPKNDPGYRPIPADCKRAIKKLWGVDGPWHRVSGE